MKTTCSKCSKLLEPNRIGKQRYCKSCHNENMRKNRPKHRELSEEQRMKANARAYLNVYIKRGLVLRQPCSVCENPIAEGHHNDYTKPLEVIWLCRNCHMDFHKE